MDPKVERMTREFEEMKRQWDQIWPTLRDIRTLFDDLKRELGVNRGRLLSDQMDELEKALKLKDHQMDKIQRTTEHTEKLVQYNEINIKEIMKALALIYRNVDELEEELLPERKTR